MEAFRDKSSPKVENEPFLLHLIPNFLDRDESFFSILNAETLRKPTVSGTFRYGEYFPLKQGLHMCTCSEKPNGISMILRPFWALSACDIRTDGRTDARWTSRPSEARSTRLALIPCAGVAPPLKFLQYLVPVLMFPSFSAV